MEILTILGKMQCACENMQYFYYFKSTLCRLLINLEAYYVYQFDDVGKFLFLHLHLMYYTVHA